MRTDAGLLGWERPGSPDNRYARTDVVETRLFVVTAICPLAAMSSAWMAISDSDGESPRRWSSGRCRLFG